jgi:uncharacterized caspase-like protein
MREGGLLRFLIIALLALTSFGTPASAKRVALVIANSRYAYATTLKNPVSDARLIAGALRSAGFDSVEQFADLNKAGLEAALLRFGKRAENADVALIYYAGHGIEAGGENYLIPTDARLERDRDLDVEATRLETALRMGDGARMRIVILDACRNNPFLASMQRTIRSRAVGRGLAAIEPEGETLVVYAAKAGATASDGEGANSPFASALAQRLVQPGLEIGIMFRSVRDDVLRRTNREQEPFTYGSLSGNAFYFVPPRPSGQVAGTIPAPGPSISDESLFWQGALTANTQSGYRDYLARYPKGQFAGLARENLAQLTAPLPMLPAPQGSSDTSAIIRQSRYDNGMFPNMSRGFTDNGFARIPAGDVAEVLQPFSFRQDRGLRQRLREKMLGAYGKPGSDLRKQFEVNYPVDDPFRIAAPFVAQYGLSFDNAVDAAFAFFEAYRKQGTANWQPATAFQSQIARKQIAGAMARDPIFKAMKAADLQTASDEMWFTAIANMTIDQMMVKQGSKAQQQFRDNISGTHERIFGFSIETLKITDRGYAK